MVDLALTPGRNLLVTGPSGAGKSTLFRALAGVWPFGAGAVAIPADGKMMLLPQKPYMPIGHAARRGGLSRRAGVAMTTGHRRRAGRRPPAATGRQARHRRQLVAKAFGRRAAAPGDRPRLAGRPDWLLLDEATAALDEETEAAIYAMLSERLPQTTLVSIGHRTALGAFHAEKALVKDGSVVFSGGVQ